MGTICFHDNCMMSVLYLMFRKVEVSESSGFPINNGRCVLMSSNFMVPLVLRDFWARTCWVSHVLQITHVRHYYLTQQFVSHM